MQIYFYILYPIKNITPLFLDSGLLFLRQRSARIGHADQWERAMDQGPDRSGHARLAPHLGIQFDAQGAETDHRMGKC